MHFYNGSESGMRWTEYGNSQKGNSLVFANLINRLRSSFFIPAASLYISSICLITQFFHVFLSDPFRVRSSPLLAVSTISLPCSFFHFSHCLSPRFLFNHSIKLTVTVTVLYSSWKLIALEEKRPLKILQLRCARPILILFQKGKNMYMTHSHTIFIRLASISRHLSLSLPFCELFH